jgi:hypothetical protein
MLSHTKTSSNKLVKLLHLVGWFIWLLVYNHIRKQNRSTIMSMWKNSQQNNIISCFHYTSNPRHSVQINFKRHSSIIKLYIKFVFVPIKHIQMKKKHNAKTIPLAYLTSSRTLASYLLPCQWNVDVDTGKNPGAFVHINSCFSNH